MINLTELESLDLHPKTIELLERLDGRENVTLDALADDFDAATEALTRAENEARLIVQLVDVIGRREERRELPDGSEFYLPSFASLNRAKGAAVSLLRNAAKLREYLNGIEVAIRSLDGAQEELEDDLLERADRATEAAS